MTKKAFAIGAHPDDVEFFMAGTMLLLQRAGYEIHYMTIANGSCGTMELDRETIIDVRRREARAAARSAAAVFHESLVDDIAIFYERNLLQQVTSVIRTVEPDVILTHALEDYMEDHANTARLAVSGAFCRGLANFPVIPGQAPVYKDVAVYHAQPHLHRDPLGRKVQPAFFVDITSVLEKKIEMLLYHKSQKDWLDKTQGMEAYQNTLKELSREAGVMSGCFEYAEGWRRHLYVGLSSRDDDPLCDALKERIKQNPSFA